MKFVDRSKEIAALEREYHREEASLVIIYGRRRVGKTEEAKRRACACSRTAT